GVVAGRVARPRGDAHDAVHAQARGAAVQLADAADLRGPDYLRVAAAEVREFDLTPSLPSPPGGGVGDTLTPRSPLEGARGRRRRLRAVGGSTPSPPTPLPLQGGAGGKTDARDDIHGAEFNPPPTGAVTLA